MSDTRETERLRVALVSALLAPRYGGPAVVLRSHAEALAEVADVSVFGVADASDMAEVQSAVGNARIFPSGFPRRWFRGVGLAAALDRAAAGFDLLHAHMLWDHPVWAAAQAARRRARPFVITPHGSVAAPWRRRAPHKLAYRRLVLDGVLRRAAAIHALSEAERRALEEFGVDCPVRVIPNGAPPRLFELPRGREPAERFWPALRHRRIALYLGRLWSEKGLDILPEAWLRAHRGNEWSLVLAGPDYRGYEPVLRARIAALGVEPTVLLTGAVEGDRKDALFGAAELFVLPSHGEGCSMSLVEAMAAGVPSLYTAECAFPALAQCGGGWEIPCAAAPLAESLRSLTGLEPDQLEAVGRRARALARERHTMAGVAARLLRLYQEALACTS
jgi:glycosyltransferase involved in cell wall biosynthesis